MLILRKKLIEAMKSGDQEVISSLAAPSSDSKDDAHEAATDQKLDRSRSSMSARSRTLVCTKTLGPTKIGLAAKVEVPLRSASVPAGFNSNSLSSSIRERLDGSGNQLSEGGLRLLGMFFFFPCLAFVSCGFFHSSV